MAQQTSKRGDGKTLRKEKQPHYRLNKDQKLYVRNFVALENRIQVCREYIELWMQFFRYFAEDLTGKEISAAEEKEFFQAMSLLARKHFAFCELMANKFDRGREIITVLCTAGSLSNVQMMNENTRDKLWTDWHSLLLDMNKSLGRLLRMLPGELTLSEALAMIASGQPIGDSKKHGKQLKETAKQKTADDKRKAAEDKKHDAATAKKAKAAKTE